MILPPAHCQLPFLASYQKQNSLKDIIKDRLNNVESVFYFSAIIAGAGSGNQTRIACLEGRNNNLYTIPAYVEFSI